MSGRRIGCLHTFCWFDCHAHRQLVLSYGRRRPNVNPFTNPDAYRRSSGLDASSTLTALALSY